MPNLPVRSGGVVPSRLERQVSKAIDHLLAEASVEAARARSSEAVEVAKVEAIASVGLAAMTETSTLSAAEAFYAARNPGATPRLSYVADATTTAMVKVVNRMERRLS